MGTATTVAWAVATVYARPDPDGSNAAGTDQTLPVVQSGGEGGIRTLGQLSLTPVFKSHNSPSQLSSALSNTSVIGTRKREDWPLFAENPTTVPKERRLDSLDPKSCTPYSAWPPTIVCADSNRGRATSIGRRLDRGRVAVGDRLADQDIQRTGLAVRGEPGVLEIPLDPNGSPLGMTALIRRPTVCGP